MHSLEAQDLHIHYGPIRAVAGVSFTVPAGSLVALLGANGAGKSTIIRAVAGLIPVAAGRILLSGEEIQGLPPHEIVRRGVAVCPEGRRVFRNLTVQENLLLGGWTRERREQEDTLAHIYRLFPRLAERRRQRAGTLSGGEQQMLALGRALMSRPRLLLLDEPSLGLAPLLVREVFKVVARLKETGVSILLVEQNAAAALELADYAYILENGRLTLEGKGTDLLTNDHLRRAYLGETPAEKPLPPV
ncbi:MAG: ABC transporter ATP-binding protein [Desulfobaccales bacterium]